MINCQFLSLYVDNFCAQFYLCIFAEHIETSMKKVLITGAGGFIGSFLVEEALSRGYEVWAGVRPSTSREFLTDNRIRFIDLQFSDLKQLQNQLTSFKNEFGGWDYIIHNLGATKVRKSSDFVLINYQYTRNLVDTLIACDMLPHRFIYMSSLSVCGPFSESDARAITADFVPCPNTDYGLSKRKTEIYLESLQNFPFVILRPTGVYGPREKDYFLMVKTIQSGFDFSVGFAPQYLSFIYVKDLARVAFLAIEHDVERRTYFISDGNVYLASDFRKLTMQNLKKRFVLPITLPLFVVRGVAFILEKLAVVQGRTSTLNSDKYNIMSQRNWNCDITPLKSELGFEAQYDLEKGLKECISWYKQNNWI